MHGSGSTPGRMQGPGTPGNGVGARSGEAENHTAARSPQMTPDCPGARVPGRSGRDPPVALAHLNLDVPRGTGAAFS